MVDPKQQLFAINKSLARKYLNVAQLRGLEDVTAQEINLLIQRAVEPDDNSFGSEMLRLLGEFF